MIKSVASDNGNYSFCNTREPGGTLPFGVVQLKQQFCVFFLRHHVHFFLLLLCTSHILFNVAAVRTKLYKVINSWYVTDFNYSSPALPVFRIGSWTGLGCSIAASFCVITFLEILWCVPWWIDLEFLLGEPFWFQSGQFEKFLNGLV